jgi:hypothetical protein
VEVKQGFAAAFVAAARIASVVAAASGGSVATASRAGRFAAARASFAAALLAAAARFAAAIDAEHAIKQLEAEGLATQAQPQHNRSDNNVPFHRATSPFPRHYQLALPVPAKCGCDAARGRAVASSKASAGGFFAKRIPLVVCSIW